MTPHQHCVIARQHMANIANHKMVGALGRMNHPNANGRHFSITGGRWLARGLTAPVAHVWAGGPGISTINTYTGGIIGCLLR